MSQWSGFKQTHAGLVARQGGRRVKMLYVAATAAIEVSAEAADHPHGKTVFQQTCFRCHGVGIAARPGWASV